MAECRPRAAVPPKGFRKVGDEVVERELDDDGLGLT